MSVQGVLLHMLPACHAPSGEEGRHIARIRAQVLESVVDVARGRHDCWREATLHCSCRFPCPLLICPVLSFLWDADGLP